MTTKIQTLSAGIIKGNNTQAQFAYLPLTMIMPAANLCFIVVLYVRVRQMSTMKTD